MANSDPEPDFPHESVSNAIRTIDIIIGEIDAHLVFHPNWVSTHLEEWTGGHRQDFDQVEHEQHDTLDELRQDLESFKRRLGNVQPG